MKGIILAGGSGTRLYPATLAISKQLLPVYDKPTIYYPLSTLMLAGIKDILIISTPRDIPLIQSLLQDGSQFGISISYEVQAKPEGIAQAFIIAEKFINNSPSCLILGDNIFYGHDMPIQVEKAYQVTDGAIVFGYQVSDPERYGVVDFDKSGKVLSIEEKPQNPKSNWAVTGLYFYDKTVCQRARNLKPSKRGELEITDLNRGYLDDQKLKVELFGRGIAWLDTGTCESLLSSSQFVQTIEERQGLKIACLEEIALLRGFINKEQFVKIAEGYPSSKYGLYLKQYAKRMF
ncbi:MAG: glucose-1-phosphate thymidylyltransferase RfbA [Bdellovibrionota bacterium]